jgi:hypothetical protein
MFVPVVLETSTTSFDESLVIAFSTFRKSLKAELVREYEEVYGSLEEKKNTKELMRSLNGHVIFDSVVSKVGAINSSQAAGEYLASVTLMVFKFLCSLNLEFDADREIKIVSGIIQNGPPEGARARISYALDVLEGLCETYSVFDGFVTDKVEKIIQYFEDKMFRL